MKRVFKRWLAMMLAVLMVMGTLPTTAWAARMTEDESPAEPVLEGKNDPVVDTMGKFDDGDERPIDPVDPDPEPGDLNAAVITGVTIDSAAVDSESGVFATGQTKRATDGDTIAIMILPRFKLTNTGSWATITYENWNSQAFTNAFITPNVAAITALDQFKNANMPYAYFRTGTEVVGAQITLNWDGTVKKGDTTVATQTLGSLDSLKRAYLAEWATGKTFYDAETNAVIDPAQGLPFEVFIGGTETGELSFRHARMNIKVTTQPLKVVVMEKQVPVLDSGTGEGMTLPEEGGTVYTYVKVINQTPDAMTNVTVQLRRNMITTADPGDAWGNTSVAADQGSASIDGTDWAYGDYNFILGHTYGFEGTTPWGTYTIANLGPGEENAVLIPIITPEITDEGIIGDEIIAEGGSLADFGVLQLFYDEDTWEEDAGFTPRDAWSNYTAVATVNTGSYAGSPASASDNGGIQWSLSLEVEPKVRLVDFEGNPISDRMGQPLNANMVHTGAKVDHTVVTGVGTGKTLTWIDEEGGYYGLTGGETVEQNDNVRVDGFQTGIRIKKGFTDVPAYAVTVTDDPIGAAGADAPTAKAKGAYLWDTTKTSRVEYAYYAQGATVGLYAKDPQSAFASWSGATVRNGTPSGITGLGSGAANGNFNIATTKRDSDIDIVANYNLVTLNFLTTRGGQEVTSTRDTDHVYELRLLRGQNEVATYKWSSGDDDYVRTGGLTMQGAFDPWSVTVPGNVVYTLEINGVAAKTVDTTTALPEAGTISVPITGDVVINYVIEMAGVQPQISGGSTGTTLGIPHDKNHATLGTVSDDEYVYVTPTEPASGWPVLWYPVGGAVEPGWTVAAYDAPQSLTYPDASGNVSFTKAGEDWEITGTVTVQSGDANPLVATFGKMLELWIYVDGATNNSVAANQITLKPTDGSADIAVTKDGTNGYIFTSATALAPGKTYQIWVNGFNTGLTSDSATVTSGAHTYIPVPLQRVTVADQSGITVTTASSFSGGNYSAGTKTGLIPNGCEIEVVHGTATGFNANGWTFAKGTATAEKGSFTYTASATAGTDSQGAQTLTALYDAAVGTATVNIFLNDAASDTPVGTGVQLSTSNTAVSGAVSLSKTATGVYSNTSVGPGTYYIWVNGVSVGQTLTVTAGQAQEEDVKYYSVTVNSSDASVSATTGTTAYVLAGTEVTISATAATYYNPNTVNWNATADSATPGTASVSNQTASAKITVNHESEYTPSFTILTTTVRYTDTKGLVKVTDSPFTVNHGTTHKVKAPELDTATMDGTYYKAADGTLWRFNGWHDGTAVRAAGYDITTITAPVTLTANWTQVYTVTYKANGHGTDPAAVKVVAGSSTNLPNGTGYTGTDYVFSGWATTDTATAADVGAGGASYTPTGSITLYAVWTEQPGTAKIMVKKDAGAYSGVEVTLYTGTTATTYKGTSNASGKISIANVPAGTYNLYVGSTDTNVDVVVPKGADSDEATVQYWTVTLNAGTGATAPKVNTANGSLVVLDGTTDVTLSASAQQYYNDAAATWTKTAGANITTASDQTSKSVTLEAITATTTYTVSFAKLKANITVNFSVDGTVGYPTGYDSIAVTGPDGNAWTASSTETSKVYSLDQGVNYTVTSGKYTRTITALAADTTVTIPYYTMTATTLGHGKVKVSDGTKTAETTNAANNSASIIVPYQANVTWTATADANYIVSKWNNVADTATTKTENAVTEAKTKTVEFSKNKFNTYLKLNVNGEHQSTAGNSHKNIKSVQLVTANNGTTAVSGVTVTHDDANQVWAATGILSTVTPYWRVTTADGGVYYTAASVADKTTDATIAAATATENLFGIVIESGAGNDSTHKPTLKAQTGSNAGERIVTRAGNANTVALNSKSGYAFKSPYLAGNATNPTNDLTTAQGTGTATAFTLAAGYSAPTDHADLYIKPQYTFSVTVRTVRGTTVTAPSGSVVVKDADGTTVQTWSNFDGSEALTGLDPDKTYKITVNGFESSVSFDKTKANGNVDVKLYTVTTKTVSKNAGTESDDANAGTAYVNLGTVGTTTKTSVYLPEGAKTDTDHTVNLKAGANTGYRAADSATNTGDSNLWTTTSTGASVPDATKNTAESTLTIAGTNGLANDVEVVAHFVLRYNATVTVSNGTTTKPASTAVFNDTGTTPGTAVTVDAGSGAKAVFTKAVGETLTGWTVKDGELYSDANLTTKITTPGTHTGTTVYFKPTANNAVLTANVEAAVYPVTVKVNLDNGAYAGRTVELRKSDTVSYTLTESATTPGEYTGNVLPGDYDVFVNGVAAGTADTEKNLNFTAPDAEANPAVNTSVEVNYYTIVLKADPAGVGNTVAFAGSTANQTSVSRIVLAKAAAYSIGNVTATAYNNDAAGTHYRFGNWAVSAPTANGGSVGNTANATTGYTLPAEATLTANNDITTDNKIILTATFVQQFKVTVKLATTAPSSEFAVQLKKTGDANWAATTSILVDKGDTVTINGAANGGGTESATRVLSEWTLEGDASTDYGTFDNSSHSAATKPADGKVGYVLQNGVYTPKQDSVLVLNAWQIGVLTAGWVFDKGTGTATSPTGAAERRSTWTKSNGQEPTKVTVKNVTGTATLEKDLSASDYTVSGTSSEYYTITADYLRDNVPNGTYTLNFEYVLGPANHPNNVNKTAVSTNFIVTSNKYKLTETNVQVEDKTSNTANPNVTARDGVIYKDHTAAAPNIKYDELIFTWYYASSYPTQTNFNNQSDPAAAAKTAAMAVTGAQLIGTTGASGVGGWSDGTNAIATGAVTVTDAMKGMYIYAVVEVDSTSETAEGAVITNAIPVDYDAKITVNENGSPVEQADADGYTVYLWPANGGTFNKNTAIATTYNTTTKTYDTTNAALNAATTYHVYVQEVEDNTDSYLRLGSVVISRTNNTATANYYTVTLTSVTAAGVTHAKDSANADVGETFTSYPSFDAATGNNTSIPSGNGVLAGATVTAKANALAAPNADKGWTQDYALTWRHKAGTATSFTNATTGTQTSTTAVSTGYRYTTNLTNKVEITGALNQNTYTIRGDIKGTGNVDTATLTYDTHTFTGTVASGGAPATNAVSFTVPKSVVTGAITGNYKISATVKNGTTLVGYSAPSKNAAEQLEPKELEQVTKNEDGKFAIHIVSTNLVLRVEDDDTHYAQAAQQGSDDGTAHGTHNWTGIFANYDAWDKVVTVSNPTQGNTPLKVTLKLQKATKQANGTFGAFADVTLTGGKDSNGIEFVDMPTDEFTLGIVRTGDDKDNSRSFTVNVPNTLENRDDVKYRFVLTSVDGRDGVTANGPSVTYNLNITIDPVTVKKVTAEKAENGVYHVTSTIIAEDETAGDTHSKDQLDVANKSANDTAVTTGDLVYTWYVTDWDAKVTLDKTNGVPKFADGSVLPLGQGTFADNGLSYTPTAAEHGKALYLVVKGQNNAKEAAMTPNVDEGDPVVLVPFDGKIIIKENTKQVEAATGYEVYLWNTADGTFDNNKDNPKLIKTVWDSTNNCFTTENQPLWASDPENPDPQKPYIYQVWANKVKGDGTLQNTNKTITISTKDWTEEVVYHQVKVADTTVHQNTYEGKLNIPDNSAYFYKAAPTERPSAAAEGVAASVNVVNNWVQTGTKVTFTYPKWDYDYDLSWTGGVTATDKAAAGNAGAVTHANVTYSSQLDEVNTELKLNLYPVKANVKGTAGWVNWFTMKLTDGTVTNTFTTSSTDGNILGIGTAVTQISLGSSATFRLPKANGYTTTANVPDQTTSGVASWNYSYLGTTTDPATSATISVNVTGDADLDTYDVNLTGEGLNMKVSETALPKDKTDNKTVQSGIGSIPNATSAAVVNGTVTQEIHLNYNYPTGQTVVMEVENTTEGTPIWNVTRTAGAANTSDITAGAFTGGKMEPAGKEEITLTIADGLDAGTYTYSAEFSFTNQEAAGGRSAKVTYNLTVVVDPLPFTGVTTKANEDGSYEIGTYAVTPNTKDEITGVVPDTTGVDSEETKTALSSTTDYKYQWVRADMSATVTASWNAGTLTITGGDKITTNGGGKKYTPVTADEGKALYLVIYAVNGTNATDCAISEAITTGYTGVVKVNKDGTQETGANDPGYTVKFLPAGGGNPVPGVWSNASNGYTATLDPNVASYTVQVGRTRDDSTNLVTLTDKVITNADRDETVDYFTVNAVNFVNKEYQTGTGEDFTGVTITPTFTIGTGHDPLANGTPVLSGQSIAAKAPALSAPNADKAWTQDYTLTWRQKSNDNTATSVADAALTDTEVTKQTASAAIANGAYAYGAVTHKTFIGGRLDQKTYAVVGTVKNETGMTGGHVLKVELAKKDSTVKFVSQTTDSSNPNHLGDGNNNGTHGEPNDTVTFTVVKGVYDITAFDGTNTTIQRVTVNADDTDTDKTRNKETLTPAVETNDRVFTIYVAGTVLKLGVADNEGSAPHNNATSEGSGNVPTNYKHAYNEEIHYFNATTGAFPLTLSNSGNTDLKLGAPKVYKLAAGTVNASTNMTAVTLGTAQTLTSGSYTDDNLTISGLGIANTALAVGKTTSGGALTLKKTAANKDDAIYVVEFPSTYADTNGATPAGPTVYYVLDLTVNPLPIVSVTTAKNDTTGELSLEGYDKNDASNKTGLDHVMVDHDGNVATDAVAANSADANLKDADFSFVWAVSDRGDLTAANFEIDTANNKIIAKDGAATVDNTLGKNRQPSAAEEGKFFYLIAYRKDANSNASKFAVSDAVYAQVTISMKTQRYSDKSLVADTSVQIEGTYGTGETAASAQSNSGTLVIPVANGKIAFAADEADNESPASAKYYFVGWGPENDDRVEVDADNRLAMTYTATKQDTVIGYYDLLPTLTGADGCTIGAATIPEANRTFHYTHNDGSGNVRIEIKPADGSHFLSVTGADDEDLTSPRVLNATAFEKIAGQTSGGTIGGDGDYVLTNSWITANLDGDQDYVITFFDLEKGVENDGYAGYDRAKAYVTSTGDKDVTAVVADVNKGQGHTVQVTNGGVSDGVTGETSTASTVNGVVTIHANPAAGYVFTGWKITSGTGRFLEDKGETKEVTSFRPTSLTATVEASFAPADFEVSDGKALVIYGNGDFEADSKTDVSVSKQESTNMSFTYAVATEDELKALDAAGALPADYTAKPDWLTLNNDGTFSFTTNAKATGNNVEVTDPTATSYSDTIRIEDEVVVYVKITEANSGEARYAKFVVDVEPGKLTVEHANDQQSAEARGEAYKAANLTDPNAPVIPVDENGIPMYNQTVLKQLFAYEQVKDQANSTIEASHDYAGDKDNNDSGAYTNGTWTVNPGRFQGTGEASTYTFTFTYKPDNAAEKWNYAAAKTDMTLVIAKPPVGAEFADTIKEFADVENILKPAGDGNYSLVEKPADYDAATATAAPEAMAYTDETFRKGETLTYLDDEPKYTVKLKSLDAAIWGVTFTPDKMDGFKLAEGSAYPTFTDNKFASTDGEKTFDLQLAPVEGTKWVGPHHALFTLTGYASEEEMNAGGEPSVKATYELIVEMLPKVITSLDVKVTDPETDPDEVKGTLEGDPTPKNLEDEDSKGNTPVKETTVEWTPESDQPDAPNTKVEVTVEIDPNYIYTKDEPGTPDEEPEITDETELTVTDKLTPPPTVERDDTDGDHIVHITQMIPCLMHDDVLVGSDPANTTGPKEHDTRPTVRVQQGGKIEDSYQINLGAYGENVYDVEWTVKDEANSVFDIGAVLKDIENGKEYVGNFEKIEVGDGNKKSVVLDLSGLDTTKTGTYNFTLEALGKANTADGERTIRSTYVFRVTIYANNPPPTPPEVCPCKVFYHIGIHGTTTDTTVEDVSEKNRPSKVPTVTPLDGYTFRGWSLTNPATLKNGEKITLVDPKTVDVKGETMTFYAVIVERPYHEHYVIGYPNGNFGPADNINRASVATIIARAILPGFVEGASYGNPGGYSDVSGHWAESAIAYCSKYGVFEGYLDGTFKPDQPITRQEFALVIARLDGVMAPGKMDFVDIDEAGDWALGGIYTAYAKGWVNGYTDGTFKPLANIRRDEAVKVFNAYLNRGVDADGLHGLTEYVHSGVASNITENGTNEYMTWPDVPREHWAYYEIIEAANDHEYEVDFESDRGYTVPETWEKCWIDERWRYHDDANDGGPNAAMVSAGFQVWLH